MTETAQGAAYAFRMPASGWKNTTGGIELISSDGAANDAFGLSVSIGGSTVTVGAIRGVTPGSAYVFAP